MKTIKPQFFTVFYEKFKYMFFSIFWDLKTFNSFDFLWRSRSVVLGGFSVKISSQSGHYFQRYWIFSASMFPWNWLCRHVTLVSRCVCLCIASKIINLTQKFFRSALGDVILRWASKFRFIRPILALTRKDGVQTSGKRYNSALQFGRQKQGFLRGTYIAKNFRIAPNIVKA